jgi:hypothetical protein
VPDPKLNQFTRDLLQALDSPNIFSRLPEQTSHRGVVGMESNSEFLRRRAQQEREAASKANNPDVRRIHKEMAKRYESVANDP